MRCPKCHTETTPGAANCPGCNLPTPKGKQEKARKREQEFEKKTKKFFMAGLSFDRKEGDDDEGSRTKTIIRIAIVGAAVVLAGVGCYMLVFNFWESKQVEPNAAINAIKVLRNMPSNQDGYTVDDLMKAELEECKNAGNLKGSQGWHLVPIKGSESRVQVVFSFQDASGEDHRAEWIADIKSQHFTAQTALAMKVYNK